MEVKPGDLLKFETVDPPASPDCHTNIETHPNGGDVYTICLDGSVKLLSGDDHRTIGWELIIKDDVAYAWVDQFGFEPREVRLTHVGQLPSDMVPASNYIHIPRACTPDDQASHIGNISYATYSDDEVTSPFTEDFEIKPLDTCPITPIKGPRPSNTANLETIARNLNPDLAAAASFLNDPVQTDAMARFAEGKMSYAEMRGLCG